MAAYHIKDNSVLKGIKVMCQLLQLDKSPHSSELWATSPPQWNANRGEWRRHSVCACACPALPHAVCSTFSLIWQGIADVWRLLTIMRCHIKQIQICQRELSNMSRNWRHQDPARTSHGLPVERQSLRNFRTVRPCDGGRNYKINKLPGEEVAVALAWRAADDFDVFDMRSLALITP